LSLEQDTIRMYAEILNTAEDNIKEIEMEYDKASKELEALLLSILIYHKYKEKPVLFYKINIKKIEKELFKLFGNVSSSESNCQLSSGLLPS